MASQNPVFIPGPTNIPERIRKACDIPTMDHRSAEFPPLFARAVSGVKAVMGMDEGNVVIFPSTGSGGWEAAITNCLQSGDKVLAARHGMFSQKWINLCQQHGMDVQIVDAPWGEGVPVDRYEEVLKADREQAIRAVLVTHNETATGVTSDVAAVRAALDAAGHPALLLVDGVSSIGSIPFDMAKWGVDVAITGSQKGFMLPAGLAIVGVSPSAAKAMERGGSLRAYFDFGEMLQSYESGGYPYTPAVGLISGLAESTTMLLEEGMENVFSRHHRLAEGVRQAVGAWGLAPCAASSDLNSDTVTAIVLPDGVDGNALVAHAASAYDIAFGAGLGEVAGKVFRIGHLGSLTDVMLLSGLAAAEMAMVDFGVPVELGSGVGVAQDYYRRTRSGVIPAAA